MTEKDDFLGKNPHRRAAQEQRSDNDRPPRKREEDLEDSL